LKFIALSDFQIKKSKELKINLNFIAKIYNGINLNDFSFYSKGKGYVGWLGRISPEKGIAVALKMAKKYKWNFQFAGTKHSKQYFIDEVRPYINNNIKYVGPVYEKEKQTFYGGCDVFVVPIQWDEPFGLTIIEAMACGVPVVAFNRGAMKELIVEGKTGYVVDADDEKGFAQAVEKAKKLNREECRRHVEKNFTIEKMTANYLGIYQKTLNK
ncbi:MAG: glycosyltransferase, partial [Nitrospirae bacterium]